jgi:hypothetical protein
VLSLPPASVGAGTSSTHIGPLKWWYTAAFIIMVGSWSLTNDHYSSGLYGCAYCSQNSTVVDPMLDCRPINFISDQGAPIWGLIGNCIQISTDVCWPPWHNHQHTVLLVVALQLQRK